MPCAGSKWPRPRLSVSRHTTSDLTRICYYFCCCCGFDVFHVYTSSLSCICSWHRRHNTCTRTTFGFYGVVFLFCLGGIRRMAFISARLDFSGWDPAKAPWPRPPPRPPPRPSRPRFPPLLPVWYPRYFYWYMHKRHGRGSRSCNTTEIQRSC